MLLKAIAIRAVGKRNIHHLGVGYRLLQTIGNGMIVVFCLDNGYGLVLFEIQDVIGFFRFLANDKVSFEIDSAISNSGFHRYMAAIPLCQYRRSDILQLDIFLCHL